MRNREEILYDLIYLRKDLSELEEELFHYSWDIEKPILMITKESFSNILKRSIDDKLNFEELVNWANAIECRDDIEFENDVIQENIFDLASPEINGDITKNKLEKILNSLEN